MTTGIFSEAMLEYFEAVDGAYTEFTSTEIEKSTFNVKAAIRNILVKHLGHENIPRVGSGEDQFIEFKVCKKGKIYHLDTLNIQCKFSKSNKEEMTIYFNREMTASFCGGDYWYIYFQEGDNMPVIGILSETKWSNLFDDNEIDELTEPDEEHNVKISYTVKAMDMEIVEETSPACNDVVRTDTKKIVKSLSADEAAVKTQNQKIKGNMGEELVIEIEKRRLSLLNRADLIPKIAHVAKCKDGLGYDIISIDVDNNGNEREIYIEVKTTAGNKETPFYVSQNELEVSRKYKELYYIYRIYNLSEKNKIVNYYTLNGAIDEHCELVPIDYIAVPKQ